ncbi:MAG: phosphoadenosine phosphosulfate reductase family protein [Tannerella sp.]|jgi:phosphoadenosine phosphosulfate reductase|nr:phosphoadenosine phosphosulfate reductase family protein [Tannerella sp.]
MIDTKKIMSMLQKSQMLAEIYNCKLNLGFSGGKDSVVLKYFADYHNIDYVANFNNTQIEQYKGMLKFIKTNYPDVIIIHPEKKNSFFELMKKKGIPSLFRRWCCESLKHSNPKLSEYKVNVMGVRGEESIARFERGEISVFGKSKRSERKLDALKKTFESNDSIIKCEGRKDKVNIYPIFDLTEKEVYEIIKVENLTIPDIYYSGCGRLGCAFCPFASPSENYQTIKSNPSIAKMWIRILSNEYFLKKRQRNVIGKTDGTGLFFLYINKMMMYKKTFNKGLMYLNEKDMYGKTGLELFEEYLKEHNVI